MGVGVGVRVLRIVLIARSIWCLVPSLTATASRESAAGGKRAQRARRTRDGTVRTREGRSGLAGSLATARRDVVMSGDEVVRSLEVSCRIRPRTGQCSGCTTGRGQSGGGEGQTQARGGCGTKREKGLVAPKKRRSGRHAGHVLWVEKGNRAVKGLQQPWAGCTGRWRDGERSCTYL